MEYYKVIIFDLDGTLSESKTNIDSEMARLLCELLKKKKVAVISGASFPQLESQLLAFLVCPPVNLSLLPANGSAFFEYIVDSWKLVYEKRLSGMQKVLIQTAMDAVMKKNADIIPEKSYGVRLLDVDYGLTFSALGQEAPLVEKEKWDPDHKKRLKIVEDLKVFLPDIEMTIGGTTSINMTVQGADKKNAIFAVAEHFNISRDRLATDILYIGDSLFPGGNDYGAIDSKVSTRKVSGPADTKKLIRDILTV